MPKASSLEVEFRQLTLTAVPFCFVLEPDWIADAEYVCESIPSDEETISLP